jgi:hypothetical protein
LTEFIGAAEEFYRIVDIEWSQQKLHGPIMLVAQREDVGPHGPSLALGAKQNLRSQCGYSIYHRRGGENFTTTILTAVLIRVREKLIFLLGLIVFRFYHGLRGCGKSCFPAIKRSLSG